jgi:hypothetical protein
MSTESRTRAMLIDRFLPDFDETIIEHDVINAPVGDVYQTVREMDFLDIHSPLMDAAMFVRGVPERIGRMIRKTPLPPPPPVMRLADFFDGEPDPELMAGWVALGEDPPHEIVFGGIGKVWQPAIEWRQVPSEEFASFAEPDFAKIGVSFSLRNYGENRTLLSYEARTAGTDEESRKKFRRYWWLVERFVGVVMGAAVQTAKELAEART